MAELFIKHRINDQSTCGWGQYLKVVDDDSDGDLSRRPGIYGTSAAIQVLVKQNSGGNLPLIQSALANLPLLGPSPIEHDAALAIREALAAKGDLQVTYKLASLLETASALSQAGVAGQTATQSEPIVNRLLELRVPERGWPDFNDPSSGFHSPNPRATAVALLALATCSLTHDANVACHEALRWLSKSKQLRTMSMATISMISMAIDRFQASGNTDATDGEDVERLQYKCQKAIKEWVRVTSPAEVARSLEGVEYRIPVVREDSDRLAALAHELQVVSADAGDGDVPPIDEGSDQVQGSLIKTQREEFDPSSTPSGVATVASMGHRYTFLFYLPHCLVALAILSSPDLRANGRSRRFVIQVIDELVRTVTSEGYFIAAGRSLVATVEQLWIYRLVSDFAISRKSLYPSWFAVFTDTLVLRRDGSRRPRRHAFTWVLGSVLLTVGLGVGAALSEGPLALALWAAFGVIMGLVGAVLASFIKGLT